MPVYAYRGSKPCYFPQYTRSQINPWCVLTIRSAQWMSETLEPNVLYCRKELVVMRQYAKDESMLEPELLLTSALGMRSEVLKLWAAVSQAPSG
jgi:hypothetical protein